MSCQNQQNFLTGEIRVIWQLQLLLLQIVVELGQLYLLIFVMFDLAIEIVAHSILIELGFLFVTFFRPYIRRGKNR